MKPAINTGALVLAATLSTSLFTQWPAAGTLTERFRRPTFGRLEIDITIDDPTAYTRPWTVRVNQRLLADTELIEFVCLENEKFSSRFRQ